MLDRLKLFAAWLRYFRSIDDKFSLVQDLRWAWRCTKRGMPDPRWKP